MVSFCGRVRCWVLTGFNFPELAEVADWFAGGGVRSGDFQRLFSWNLTKWSSLDSSEGGKTSVLKAPSSAVSLFFYPLGATPEGADKWANFLITAPGKDRGSENLSKSDLGLAPWSKKKMASAGSTSNRRLVLASCGLHPS